MTKVVPIRPVHSAQRDTDALTKARLEGLRNLERLAIARRAVDEADLRASIARDVVTVAMRRALDHIPGSLLLEIADEVVREYKRSS